ncbi:MAG TPA: hypothetical protein VK524_07405, partial [Polyangiaceae bacterium]|nr:hypothetical protein [Polyangiaceae bacterium]
MAAVSAPRTGGPPPLPASAPASIAPAAPARAEEPGPHQHFKTRVGFGSPADQVALAQGAPLNDEQRAQRAVEFVRTCETELARRPAPPRAGRLHYEIARLFESVLGDRAQAATHYQKAQQLCPEHLPTLQGTRRALLEQKNFAGALPLFDAEAKLTADPRRK